MPSNQHLQSERPTVAQRDHEAENYATDRNKAATVLAVGSMIILFLLALFVAVRA